MSVRVCSSDLLLWVCTDSTCLGPLRSLATVLAGGRGSHRFGCFDLSVHGFCTSLELQRHRSPGAQLHSALVRLSQGKPLCSLPATSLAAAAAVRFGGRAAMALSGVGSSGDTSSAPSDTCGLHAAPNGVLFASASSRPGVLPRLLREILETRCMVKRAMKQVPLGSPLYRTLNARQVGLKLIANVTYGYTCASFSGRMPSVHIADAIVQVCAAPLFPAFPPLPSCLLLFLHPSRRAPFTPREPSPCFEAPFSCLLKRSICAARH